MLVICYWCLSEAEVELLQNVVAWYDVLLAFEKIAATVCPRRVMGEEKTK